jgi:hypothetical protein
MLGHAPESIALLDYLLEIPGWFSTAYVERDFRLDPIRESLTPLLF